MLRALLLATLLAAPAVAAASEVVGRLPSARYATAAAWAGGEGWIFGGVARSSDANPIGQRDVLRLAPDGSTKRVAELPEGLHGLAAAPVAGRVLLLGGENPARARSDAVLAFDPRDASIERLAGALPTPRRSAAAVAEGGAALVFGGFDGAPLADVLRVDAAGRVETVGALPSPRQAMAAVAADGRVLLFGGLGSEGDTDEILAYADGAFAVVGRLPSARHAASAVWTGERALVFGGYRGSVPLDEVVAFDPRTGAAEVVDRLPSPRASTSAVWTGERALVVGGFSLAEVVAVAPPAPAPDEAAERATAAAGGGAVAAAAALAALTRRRSP